MPFPYVPVPEFRTEYPPSPTDLGFDTESDFKDMLTRVLKQESERVEGEGYAGRSWRGDGVEVPGVVYDSVVRLARVRLDARYGDVLSSEQSPGGRQESYRNPREVREQVREELQEAGFGEGNFWTVTR